MSMSLGMAVQSIELQIPDAEYQMLFRRAKAEGKSMPKIVREAIRARLLADAVDPNDSLFKLFPLIEKRAKTHRLSEVHESRR
jgi:hypothetical protein